MKETRRCCVSDATIIAYWIAVVLSFGMIVYVIFSADEVRPDGEPCSWQDEFNGCTYAPDAYLIEPVDPGEDALNTTTVPKTVPGKKPPPPGEEEA